MISLEFIWFAFFIAFIFYATYKDEKECKRFVLKYRIAWKILATGEIYKGDYCFLDLALICDYIQELNRQYFGKVQHWVECNLTEDGFSVKEIENMLLCLAFGDEEELSKMLNRI